MKAEIISIGSELTTGQNLDTNGQWLSQRLAEIGIAVGWHTTVADDLEDNVAAFRIAAERAQLVIATGGLGPTQDDLTREGLARLTGVELVFHQESFEWIQQMFVRRSCPGRDLSRSGSPNRAGGANHPRTAGRPRVWRGRRGVAGQRLASAGNEAPNAGHRGRGDGRVRGPATGTGARCERLVSW